MPASALFFSLAVGRVLAAEPDPSPPGQETGAIPAETPQTLPPTPEPDSSAAPRQETLVPPRFEFPVVVAWPATVPYTHGPADLTFELAVDESGKIEMVTAISGEEPFLSATREQLLVARMAPALADGVAIAVSIPFHLEILPPPVTIEGTLHVLGGGTAPLTGARVSAGGVETVTDDNGHFEMRGLAPGNYTLIAVADGMRIDPLPFIADAVTAAIVEVWARPETVSDGIVATYRKGRTEMARRSLSAEELRTAPGSLGDPLRAVVNLPGVVRSPLEMGWLLVRGGDPRDTAVYVDGVRLPLVYHLGGFTSVMHPAFISRVDYLPGGGGVRYGRATAGTVDLITRGREPRAEARVGANLVFASAYGNLPWPKHDDVTVSASFRRSYLDAVLSPFLPEQSQGAIPRFWDWQGRADFGADTSIFTFGFVDTIDVSDNEGGVATIAVATQRVHARTRVDVAGRDLLIFPFLAWESTSFELADWSSSSEQSHSGGGLRAEFPDPGEGLLGWSAGIDMEAFAATLHSAELARTEPVFLPDTYADFRLGNPEIASATAGLRVDTLIVGDQPDRVAFSPRLSLQKSFNPRAGISIEAGIYHEPPPWELVLGPPEGAVLELDESINLSVEGRFGRGPIDAGADVWSRVISRTTRIEFDGSLDQGDGLAYGCDIFVNWKYGRWTGMFKYGYGESRRRDDPFDPLLPSDYDQPHTLGLVSGWDLGKNWNVAGRFRYASGFPVRDGGIEAFDLLTLTTTALDPPGGRLDPYHSLDIKFSKRFLFRKWRLDAYLDIENVYDRRIPEPVITGFTDVVFTGYGYGLTTLPIFGVEGQWGGDPRRP